MKALIIGAGYVGGCLGDSLRAQGIPVTGWVRSGESAQILESRGWCVVSGDVADPACWEVVGKEWDAVIYCPSTRGGGEEEYRHIHIRGLGETLRQCRIGRLVYTSATSVYGQDDGSLVTEQSPVEPEAATSRVLLEAERLVAEAGGVSLRVSGIYGPERGVLFQRLLAGEAFIPDGLERWINMIHRDDVAGAIAFSLDQKIVPAGVYNVTDDEPVTYAVFYQWLCEQLGRPLPPVKPVAEGLKKRGFTRKRVSNVKLRALGWHPDYPTFREGYAGMVEEESQK